MTYGNFGADLFHDHQELDRRLTESGRDGLLSFIDACIAFGYDTDEAILAKVQQVGGPYYDREVPELLAIHSSPLARPQIWCRDKHGTYRHRDSEFVPDELSFWRAAKSDQ